MTFTKKIILLNIINIFLIGSVYFYFWVVKTEYYFPDNYETAFACFGYTVIFCFIMSFLFIVFHVIKTKCRKK